ncbi:MAG: ABC transporter substrate-binding protein [Bacteroidia bacterium]|nr:ABC transporter substrate-binding protein [Bacteroidia bacterium]
MGRLVVIEKTPKRIVSLVPSQTELLYTLGLDAEVIAQTLFCIYPATQDKNKPRIGGTKTLNTEKIKLLKPDLIIGNKEENEQVQIEALMKEFPLWMSDIHNLEEALEMIGMIGKIVDRESNAQELILRIRNRFNQLIKNTQHLSCIYLIWHKPFMAAGSDTFINDMLCRCGLTNLCIQLNERYPKLEPEKIKSLSPQLILLSSEPYPFNQNHIEELKEISPTSKIILVNGELFSWYGSRLLHSITYFENLMKEFN